MRDVANFIKERLDRVCANPWWQGLYLNSKVYVLASQNSDHAHIFFTFSKKGERQRRCYLKPFRYEAG
jgi:hypothetical protein